MLQMFVTTLDGQLTIMRTEHNDELGRKLIEQAAWRALEDPSVMSVFVPAPEVADGEHR